MDPSTSNPSPATPPRGKGDPSLSLHTKQACDKIVSRDLEMPSNVGQNCGERSNAEGVVLRDGNMMFPVFKGREAKMATSLASHPVSEGS
jgi:hypothetical protein